MSKTNKPKERPEADFFRRPRSPAQRQYEALRAFFLEGVSAAEAAAGFGYRTATLNSLCRDFRRGRRHFFLSQKPGPKQAPKQDAARARVIQLRKQNYSIYDIQSILAAEGLELSHVLIGQILRQEGFARLPRRRDDERRPVPKPDAHASADVRALDWASFGRFETQAGGLFVFVPTLVAWQLERWPARARLPGSQMIPALNSLLSLLALKLTGKERLSHVMDVCADPGFALFAALNVLPKTTALSTYSYRVSHDMTLSLLDSYHRALKGSGLLHAQCFNLDFHAIAQRGDTAVLEKHYVSKRSRRERAVLVFLAQDGDTQVLCYSNADLLKRDQAEEVLRFVEFWQERYGAPPPLLIFDSQLTSYQVLDRLDDRGIRFITLRRRGQALLRALDELPAEHWNRMQLAGLSRRFRSVRYHETQVSLRDLKRPLRQIAVAGLGHEKPTLFLTNDHDTKALSLVERYAHRMLIENSIAENVDFFHLDALGSAIALQVDLDVLLTLVGNGLYRSLAQHLKGFETARPKQLFRRFLNAPARVNVTDDTVTVRLRRHSHHPILLASGQLDLVPAVPWWQGRRLRLEIA
ncbi:MAG: transposase [Paracoccaceae bacterium]